MTFNYTILTTPLQVNQMQETQYIGQSLNPTGVLYSYLFNDEVSLKDRNKFLLLFLQTHIVQGKIDIIEQTLSEACTLFEIHISFLKAMLMMTEHVEAVSTVHNKLQQIYSERMPY